MQKSRSRSTARRHVRAARNFDAVIGARLRAHRLSRRMSQKELAGKLGVTFRQVQEYEHGVVPLGIGRLKDISRALGVPVRSWLVDDKSSENRRPGQADTEFITNARAIVLLKSFLKIGNTKTQNLVIEYCERLAAKK
jgi:transcriptional regulator with XRE-family HTH domain